MGVLDAFDLSGRVAAVTGAGSGIGRAAAEVLAGAGAAVVAGDIDADAVAATAAAIGVRGVGMRIDVTRKADLDAMADRAVSEYGRLDVFCNVAGVAADGLIADATDEQVDRAFAVNLKGVLYGCQAAVRVMQPQGSGSIINVGSTGVDAPAPRYGIYAMTKAAVTMLTKTLALEVGRYGIRVNTVAPGATITAFTQRHMRREDGTLDQERYDAFVEQMTKLSPLRRIGEPEDQAYLMLYLASDASRFCTGQVWRANGGQTIV